MPSRFAYRTNWNLTTNAYTDALEEHRRAGRELLDLTASNPTTVGMRYDEQRLLRALSCPEALIYQPTAKGLLSARQAIARYYTNHGASVDPEDLILTTSTSEAYSFVFRLLCDPDDVVLVPTPSYPLFDFLAELQDVKLRPYELVYDHGWQIDLHSLQSAYSKIVTYSQQEKGRAPGGNAKAVLVVHPNNPTGSFIKPVEAAQLRRFCAENNLAIISDEVFLDYSLGPTGSASLLRNDEESAPVSDRIGPTVARERGSANLTFVLSGLSKISGLPQMKVAWIGVGGPNELKRDALGRLEVIADTYLSMNAPVQWAIPALLEEGPSIQRQLLSRVRANVVELDRQLSAQKLCSRLELEGGWYAILRVPVTGSDEELAVALLRRNGVLVQPGHFYDFVTEGYLVISLITPEKIFAAGLERLFRFIAER